MRISIGADHAGFELKESIKQHLAGEGHDVVDFGPSSADRVDYPDFAKKVAESVAACGTEKGVLVCGSGIGMCIAANRFPKVRAAVVRSDDDAVLSRAHNDANIVCVGARLTGTEEACRLVDLFLNTGFEGGRHEGRVEKIEA